MSFPVTVFITLLLKQVNLCIAPLDRGLMDRVCGEKRRSMKRPDQCCLTVEMAKPAERWYMIKVLNSKSELIQRAVSYAALTET